MHDELSEATADPAAGYVMIRPSRRRALKVMVMSLSTPLLTQLLAACGSSPLDPTTDTEEPEAPSPEPPPKPIKVLFVPGFMSELYTAVSMFEQNTLNAALRNAARQYLNYEVRGVLGNVLYEVDLGDRLAAMIDIDLIPDGGLVSFHTQMVDFTAADVDFHDITDEAGFDSAQSVVHNAQAIADWLKGVTDFDVVIVSHSKGGLDTLHALITDPRLTDDDGPVVGWVALQAPFRGSPVASLAPAVGDQLLIALGGGPALSDLSPAVREAYMAENASAIASVATAIPILSCASTYGAASKPDWAAFARTVFNGSLVGQIVDLVAANVAATPLNIASALAKSATQAIALVNQKIADTLDGVLANIGLMDTTNAAMDVAGIPNDGLVPAESAQLPGSTAVSLNTEVAAGDHAAPVMITAPLKEFWSTANRNALTHDLVGRTKPE